MSTKLTHEFTYDAPLDDVARMLLDSSFREEVADRQGALTRTVSISLEQGTVLIDQVQSASDVPSFARKFVGDEINIVQQETWTSADHADVEVTIPGRPGHLRGTIRLAEDAGRTTDLVDLDIQVNIPLVGGKIEGLIADLLRKALVAENAAGRDYLSSR